MVQTEALNGKSLASHKRKSGPDESGRFELATGSDALTGSRGDLR